jgi:hypothetical protein
MSYFSLFAATMLVICGSLVSGTSVLVGLWLVCFGAVAFWVAIHELSQLKA